MQEEFEKNLTENEIIDILEDFSTNDDTIYCYDWHGFNWTIILPAIQGLLDLYNKEKAKNEYANELEEDIEPKVPQDCIKKDIIRKKIKEYKLILEKLNKKNDIERIKAINERLIAFQEILLEEN